MLGLELTTSQKVQIAFVIVVLAISGVLFFTNTRPVPNTAVSAWVVVRKFPVDPSKPMNRENPADPKKQTVVSVFGCYDGKLEICEYPNDPSRRPTIRWGEIDKRRKNYIYWKDPIAPVKAITDPYKHAMALAAYNFANGRRLGLMDGAGLTPEQLAEEAKARKVMMDSLAVTKIQVGDGSFRQDLLKPVMAALEKYRGMSGDINKDVKKAEAARKVIDLAAAYLATVEEDRYKDIEKYIAAMNNILKAEQKTIIAKAGQAYETGSLRVAAGPRITPPAAGNRANQQNRGTAPNQNRQAPAGRRGTGAPVRNVEAVTG